jgi:hypothetical protein
MQPRVPRAHQGTIIPHGLKGIKITGNASAHVVIRRFLLGRQVGWDDKRKVHEFSFSWNQQNATRCHLVVTKAARQMSDFRLGKFGLHRRRIVGVAGDCWPGADESTLIRRCANATRQKISAAIFALIFQSPDIA